jgi:hypothetical protein
MYNRKQKFEVVTRAEGSQIFDSGNILGCFLILSQLLAHLLKLSLHTL